MIYTWGKEIELEELLLDIISRLSRIARSWIFWLLIITGIAIILRSLPAWTNAAWGCDFGIYYGLTNSFIETGDLFNPYIGWGNSYQYFPVLYAITGIAHMITGIDVLVLMPKLAPIFGGLSILIFYFLVYELIKDKRVALLSSAFLAVLPFHVYQTSHASPLTMGHFFMMISLFLFVKYRQDIRYVIPLLMSTILLIMSHHFTTYFYLISLIFIVFIENASRKNWTTHIRYDTVYILIASGLIFSYWALVATPVFQTFMNYGIKIGGIYLGSSFIVPMFYLLFFTLFGIVWLKRKFNLFYIRKEPTVKSCVYRFFLTIIICLSAMLVFLFVKLPWTNFSFTPLSIVYSIPLLIVFGFGVAGWRYLRFVKNGNFVKGWILAILLSFIYALVTHSGALYPHRHLEYIMVPLSIIAVFGVKGIFSNKELNSVSIFSRKIKNFQVPWNSIAGKSRLVHKRQMLYILFIIALVTTNAVSIYPSHIALNASYEAITHENLSVNEWIKENLDENETVTCSDHRLARMVEAIGFKTTIDEALHIWDSENLSDYIDELYGEDKNYSRITHILIDDIMRERVVHVGFGKIVYMTNESYDKFQNEPFNLVYRNATMNDNFEEIHWTEIYEVNWPYIENN